MLLKAPARGKEIRNRKNENRQTTHSEEEKETESRRVQITLLRNTLAGRARVCSSRAHVDALRVVGVRGARGADEADRVRSINKLPRGLEALVCAADHRAAG